MNDSIDYAECTDRTNAGVYHHNCLLAHLEKFPSEAGHLYIPDDAFIDFARMLKILRNKLWTTKPKIHDITSFKNFTGFWMTRRFYKMLSSY